MSDFNDEDNEIDNVLAFTKRFDSNADIRAQLNVIKTKPPETVHCMHKGLYVNEHERIVKCQRCGKVIDPFDWLLGQARKEFNIDFELRGLRQEIKDHREGLEKLKREEVNTRARIKTATFKLHDIQMKLHALDKGDSGG